MTSGVITDIQANEINGLRRLDSDLRRQIQQWSSDCARGLMSRDWGERVYSACKLCDKALHLIFARCLSSAESKAYVTCLSVSRGRNKTAATTLIHFAHDLITLLDREDVCNYVCMFGRACGGILIISYVPVYICMEIRVITCKHV